LGLPLSDTLPATGDRTEFVRARLGPSGLLPIAERDSSALRALAAADALIERPAGAPAAESGTILRAYWLENGGMA
jgi:molybdopterin molybdotransferase